MAKLSRGFHNSRMPDTPQTPPQDDLQADSGTAQRPGESSSKIASVRMVERPCPLCAAQTFKAFLLAPDTVFGFPGQFRIVRCVACNMLYTHPQVDPRDITAFYPGHYAAHAPDRATRHRRSRRNPWDHLPPIGRKRLLDVGCASGAYLLRQQDQGWTVMGIEPSTRAVRAARELGLNVIEGMIPFVDMPEQRFDVITVLSVLDHVPEPLTALRLLREHLESSGRLIVLVPNAASLAARILGAAWAGWDLPRHQNHFTAQTLANMLERAGFKNIHLTGVRRPSRWRHVPLGLDNRTTNSTGRRLARTRLISGVLSSLARWMGQPDEILATAS